MKLNEVTERKAGDLKIVKKYVYGDLDIHSKNLISLEGCPKEVIGNFGCGDNQLTSLKGCPEKIDKWFGCTANQLTSFEYFPKHIGNNCFIDDNKFTSFKDIDQHIKFIDNKLYAMGMKITSGYSDLFGIDGLQRIRVDNDEISHIINKYLPEKDLINFQDEMIKSGYESYL